MGTKTSELTGCLSRSEERLLGFCSTKWEIPLLGLSASNWLILSGSDFLSFVTPLLSIGKVSVQSWADR